MATVSIQNVRLAGVAAAVPPLRTMSWEEFGASPDRLLGARRANCIPTRRAARPEQAQSDFCAHAGEQLMLALGWAPAEIDVVVMVTVTPDYPIPATAIIMQDRLGIPKSALAFDVPGGSASFLHGLQLLASMLAGGHLKRGLLLCGEVSKAARAAEFLESVEDICGHNGSVLALEHAPGATPMYFATGGDGGAHQAFYMPVGGTRCPPRAEMFGADTTERAENTATDHFIDVQAVEAAARLVLPQTGEAVLREAGLTPADLHFAFLQPLGVAAEDHVRRDLHVPPDRFHSHVREYGSGGSGSIALAMLARAASRLRQERCHSLFMGFGAGFAWGSALVTTEGLHCLGPLEIP